MRWDILHICVFRGITVDCRDELRNLSIVYRKFFSLFFCRIDHRGITNMQDYPFRGLFDAAYGSIFPKSSHANYYLLPCKLITQIRCLLNANNVYRIKQVWERLEMIPGCLWGHARDMQCYLKLNMSLYVLTNFPLETHVSRCFEVYPQKHHLDVGLFWCETDIL